MKLFIWINVVILITLLAFQAALHPTREKRAREYTQDMMYSFAFQSQSENPYLPREQTQQPYIKGVVPYRADYLKIAKKPEMNKKTLKEGRKFYGIFCQVCHGVAGEGNGPVTKKGFPPPPSLKTDRVRKMKDTEIYQIITDGFKNMPGYKSQILPKDRWKIIQYVRELQEN
jgi:mono/diheme cytochrome c family protein